jgi:outer membrane protein assembly factor BamB
MLSVVANHFDEPIRLSHLREQSGTHTERHRMKYLASAIFLISISTFPTYGADWPQWQGPDRNAVSHEKGLLQAWPQDGPPIAWRINGLGGGDSAPAVADGRIFGMSNRDGKEIVWALLEADGKELWATPLGDAVEQRMPQSKEGPGGTPTVDGDRLFVIGINCSTPIYEDGLVFAASAYGSGGGAVKLVKSPEGEIEADEVYFTQRMQNHHGGMIVVDGCLYGANGGNGGGFLTCLDFQTGEVLWRDRNAPKGSLLLADGRLYLRSEEDELLLIEPSRDGLIERGRFKQPDRSDAPAWAHPVVANGKLYIRDQDLLLCYDVKAK